MEILFAHNKYTYKNQPVHTYSSCMVNELKTLGYNVTEIGKDKLDRDEYRKYDLLIDVDSGRDSNGRYKWHLEDQLPIPTIAYFIDTHGHADLHSRLSLNASHVFFAVWDKRETFSGHPSAHWAPNFTDLKFFNRELINTEPAIDFGFFGSKNGLVRADPMKMICENNNYSYDIRQVCQKGKHQWPATGEAMANCKILFNHGQKHDDPNLRVMESMAVGRPLITPQDPRSGIGYLFEPWQDYIPYTPYTYKELQERMVWAMKRPDACKQIAENAYNKIVNNHLTTHRVRQIMEIVNA